MAKRTAKTTYKQYEIYVKYLENCSFLRTGKTAPDKEHNNEIWKKLTLELNSTGVGPSRNVEAWKKVFSEWKSTVRRKARENKFLTDLEKTLINITGTVVIDGIQIEEIGLTQNINTDEDEMAQATELQSGIPNVNAVESLIEASSANITVETQNQQIEASTSNYNLTATPSISGGKKRKRETTENILLEEYKKSQTDNNNQLKGLKATVEQYETYLRFLMDENLLINQNIPRENNWILLAKELNKLCGPKRDVEQWKQTFAEWRSKVKRKAREIYISQNETGGGLGTEKFLTSLEIQLISVLGLICIEGINVPELGLGSSEDILQNSRKIIEPIAKWTLENTKRHRITLLEERIINNFHEETKNEEVTLNKLVKGLEAVMCSVLRLIDLKIK